MVSIHQDLMADIHVGIHFSKIGCHYSIVPKFIEVVVDNDKFNVHFACRYLLFEFDHDYFSSNCPIALWRASSYVNSNKLNTRHDTLFSHFLLLICDLFN